MSEHTGDRRFCPICNASINAEVVEKATVFMACSHCHEGDLAMFYEAGSDAHKLQIEAWTKGEKLPNMLEPPPLPADSPK